MSAKSYLSQYQRLEETIGLLETELAHKRADLEHPRGISYDNDRVSSSPVDDRLAAAFDELERAELRLKQKIVECEIVRKEIILRLACLSDQRQATALRLVYIDGMNLEQAAAKMNYSLSHARRLFYDGLKTLGRKFKDDV